ncbi:MAG: hypothetical protein ACKOU7_09160 [Ferruginibacter sp.]
MFRQNGKYRIIYLTLAVLVFALGSVFAFYDFSEKKDGMRLFGGIVFGLMAIFQVDELYAFIKKRNRVS